MYVVNISLQTLSTEPHFKLHQVAQGISYLHEKGIVHGDLRGVRLLCKAIPSAIMYINITSQVNILIDDKLHVRLMDFGLTVFADKTGSFDGTCDVGAQPWMAPELLEPQKMGLESFQRTYASDIYAFACVCIEVSTVLLTMAWHLIWWQ